MRVRKEFSIDVGWASIYPDEKQIIICTSIEEKFSVEKEEHRIVIKKLKRR